MSSFQSKLLVLAVLASGHALNLWAVDGVVLIDQNRALAGGVTPGDTPGFPVSITRSGSYRLTGNLTVPDANTTAIDISADLVTIDLNGFSIIGPTVCTGPLGAPVVSCSPTGLGSGVSFRLNQRGITVMNGVIQGMGSVAVKLTTGDSHLVQNVRAVFNGAGGISVQSGIVSGNVVNSNGGIGIGATFSTVTGNTVSYNSDIGIFTQCPGTIIGNTLVANGSTINTGVGSPGCVVSNNAQ